MFRRRGVHIPITHPSYAGIVTAKLPDSRLQTAHKKLDWVILDVPDTVIRLGCRIMSVPAPARDSGSLSPVLCSESRGASIAAERNATTAERTATQKSIPELRLHLSTSLQLRPHPQRRFNSAALSTSASTLRLHLSTSLQLAAPLNVASTSTASSTSLQLRLHLSMLNFGFNVASTSKKRRSDNEHVLNL
jgi:hypothetical protein